MKVTTREFRAKMAHYLNNLPVEITVRGKVVACVHNPSGVHNIDKGAENKINVAVTPKPRKPQPQSVNPPFNICKKHKVYYMTCGC